MSKEAKMVATIGELKTAIGGQLCDGPGWGRGTGAEGPDSWTYKEWKRLPKKEQKKLDVQLCTMEAVAWVAGEEISDHPKCACPELTDICVNANDSAESDKERNRLLEVVPLLVGSRPVGKGGKAKRAKAIERAKFEFKASGLPQGSVVGKAVLEAARQALAKGDEASFRECVDWLEMEGEFSAEGKEVDEAIFIVKQVLAKPKPKKKQKAKKKVTKSLPVKAWDEADDMEKRYQQLELD